MERIGGVPHNIGACNKTNGVDGDHATGHSSVDAILKKKWHHGICEKCGKETNHKMRGMCQGCYNKWRDSVEPGYIDKLNAYKRAYSRLHPRKDISLSKLEACEILAESFLRVGISADELVWYLAFLKKDRRRAREGDA